MVQTLNFTINMQDHLYADELSGQFSADILAIGKGKMPVDLDREMDIYPNHNLLYTVDYFIASVFLNLEVNYLNCYNTSMGNVIHTSQ